jgi:hypothetical protein
MARSVLERGRDLSDTHVVFWALERGPPPAVADAPVFGASTSTAAAGVGGLLAAGTGTVRGVGTPSSPQASPAGPRDRARLSPPSLPLPSLQVHGGRWWGGANGVAAAAEGSHKTLPRRVCKCRLPL